MGIDLEVSVGDWVRSYESGIWQVYRIQTYIGRDPVSGSERRRTTVFSKKFVTDSFKRSFKTDCCAPNFVESLDRSTSKKLADFIAKNEALYQAFCEYEPKPIDIVYNARIKIPDGISVQDIETRLADCPPLRESKIDEFLRGAGFDTEGLPIWTVQFVSKEYETIDDYLVYRFLRVLGS